MVTEIRWGGPASVPQLAVIQETAPPPTVSQITSAMTHGTRPMPPQPEFQEVGLVDQFADPRDLWVGMVRGLEGGSQVERRACGDLQITICLENQGAVSERD